MKINNQNYETYFLLYIDNELTALEKVEVELFIKENPGYTNKLKALTQTVLVEDSITFKDKPLLYRFEEMGASLPLNFKQNLYRQQAKVVDGFFTRSRRIGIASIAAILLLLLGYRIYFGEAMNNKKELSQNKQQPIKVKNDQAIVSVEANFEVKDKVLTKYIPKGIVVLADKLNVNVTPENQTNLSQQETKIVYDALTEAEIIVKSVPSETRINTTIEINSPLVADDKNAIVNNTNGRNEEQENYNKIDTDERDKNIYIANFEIDGDKLRGISRRFNAIFKRNKNEKQK
jgi:hypothetical protein